MIDIVDLYKEYKGKKIFENINLKIKEEGIHFFMGKNGAGKTTLIKCLLNLESYEGEVKLFNKRIDEYRKDIAVVYDDSPFYLNLSGIKNIEMFINRKVNRDEIMKIALNYLDNNILSKKVKKYSYGQKKKLSLILVEINKPKILLMDEISNGLDYETMTTLKGKLLEWKQKSIIILTGHQFDFYNDIIDYVYYIKENNINKVEDILDEKVNLGDIYEKYVR